MEPDGSRRTVDYTADPINGKIQSVSHSFPFRNSLSFLIIIFVGFNAVVSKSHETHHAVKAIAPIIQTYHAPATIVSPTYVAHHAPTYVAHAPVITSHATHAVVSHHAPAYVSHPVYAHSAPLLHHAPVYTHTTLLHK